MIGWCRITWRTSPRRRARWILASALVVGIATTGCGISTDETPEQLASDALPQDLQPTGSTTTTTAPADAAEVESVGVWFLRGAGDDARLVRARREVPGPATVRIVLEALFNQPPNETEREAGISSAIPPDTTIEDSSLNGDVLVLELSENFYDLEGDPSRNAFAQIVYTATGLSDVQLVQFAVDGELVEARDGSGEDQIGPLGRNDYANLDPVGNQPTS